MTPQRGPRKTFTVELPAELVDRLDEAAKERVIGRRLLIELLLTQAVAALTPPAEMELLPPTQWASPGRWFCTQADIKCRPDQPHPPVFGCRFRSAPPAATEAGA